MSMVVVTRYTEGGPLPGVFHVDLGPSVQETLHHMFLPFHTRQMDGRSLVLCSCIYVCPTYNKLPHYLQMAFLCTEVEWRPTLLIPHCKVRLHIKEHHSNLVATMVTGGVEGYSLVLGTDIDFNSWHTEEKGNDRLMTFLHC